VGTVTESLKNANHLVELSGEVFKEKETELNRIPFMSTLFEAQMRTKRIQEAIKTMEEII
jgi:ribosomal 50S subunit-associated protein YjgA (DUF615 family)